MVGFITLGEHPREAGEEGEAALPGVRGGPVLVHHRRVVVAHPLCGGRAQGLSQGEHARRRNNDGSNTIVSRIILSSSSGSTSLSLSLVVKYIIQR